MSNVTAQVSVTDNIASSLQDQISKLNPSKILVLVDSNTEVHCYPLIREHLGPHKIMSIAAGEQQKNLHTCRAIWEEMTVQQLDRSALLINLGGGVIGDMGGFCAATFKRGIRFINIPTTLLAQVDASVGGKLGIDFEGFKNHIGVFKDPAQVLICTDFLATLPHEELRSGFAEVLKHTLIKDRNYWEVINNAGWEDQNWRQHIEHSLKVKQEVVEEDPQENGLRKILNFGHTVGHAVERFYLNSHQPLLHGEAIAVGMICEAYLSQKMTGLSGADLSQVHQKITQWFGKISIDADDFQAIAENALQDKKNRDGEIKCTLLNEIGDALIDQPISTQDIIDSLAYYVD